MSALGGILNFGNTPRAVDQGQLIELGRGLDSHGPDGGDEIAVGNIGMCYRAFHTNRESRLEAQPLVTSHGHILTWNGRLDNRDELISQIRDDLQDGPPTITDLEIVMATYMKWGKGAFVRLVGDFCLALWDARLKTLYLVRDVVGTRPLNYHIDSNRVVWSTDLAVLLGVTAVSREIEDEYIAGYLTRAPELGVTPYKKINSVKPAHVLTVTQDGRREERRFWGLDPEREILYQTDDEYVDRFLHEFSGAVRCRLRSDRPIFAELSGGLDSSSTICMADLIIARGEAQTPKLETVSQVYDECPSADERKFIQMIEERRGIPGHHIREEDYRILSPLPKDLAIVTPNTVLSSYGYLTGMCKTMRVSGARVLLSGQGGDEMLGSNYSAYPEVADLLISLKLLLLHRRLQAWSQALRRPYLELFWQSAAIPMLPRKLQVIFKRGPANNIPPWFSRAFVKRMNLRERALGTADVFGFRLPSGRDQAAGFISMTRSVSLGYRGELSNIEITYPYLHRPLVEFLQAIPFEQLLRPGENRSLMRRAMRGILPEKIAQRKTKGNPREVIYRALAREWPRLRALLEDGRASALGYTETEPLLAALDRARYGCEPFSAALLPTISLELWLRALEHRCAAGKTNTDVAEALPRMISGRENITSVGLAS